MIHGRVIFLLLCTLLCLDTQCKSNKKCVISSNDAVRIILVDEAALVEQSQIGKEVKVRIKKMMDVIKKNIAELEEYANLSEAQAIPSNSKKKSITALLNKEKEFDMEEYQKSSVKDKHLMLYSLTQKKFNDLNRIVFEAETNLKAFIKKCICEIAQRYGNCTVVDSSNVLFSSGTVDITEEVISLMDKNKDSFCFPEQLR